MPFNCLLTAGSHVGEHSCVGARGATDTGTAGRRGVRQPSALPASRFFRVADRSHLISAKGTLSINHRLHQPQPYWAVHTSAKASSSTPRLRIAASMAWPSTRPRQTSTLAEDQSACACSTGRECTEGLATLCVGRVCSARQCSQSVAAGGAAASAG